MTELLQAWAERIDALSARERALLFCTVIALCTVLVQMLWLAPAQQAHTRLVQRQTEQGGELDRLRAALGQQVPHGQTESSLQTQLALAEQRLQELNRTLGASSASEVGASALERTLVQLLRRQPGLTLLQTAMLEAPATPPAGLQRRGLTVQVAGSYADLVRYLQTLEHALPHLRWAHLELDSSKAVPELRLQVYVLEIQG